MPSQGTGRVGRPMSMDSLPAAAAAAAPSLIAEVLYLLNRGTQLEHPHMICVPFAAHQPGPALRDVKARLIALRGRGMPGSFSWSYKRNYKDSFIWCDLFDDDCILPLSATGEYVLKAMELFDASSPDDEMEYQEHRYRNSRMGSPGRSSRHPSRPEHRHVENDVSLAIKKSLLLINTPGDSMDLNKQIMKNLSYSKRLPDVCSIEHSEVSSSTATYNPCFEDTPLDNKKPSLKTARAAISQGPLHTEPPPPQHKTSNQDHDHDLDHDFELDLEHEREQEKKHPERQSIGKTAAASKSCNASSQTVVREARQMYVTTDCRELISLDVNGPLQGAQSRKTTETAPKRRTWEKEIDKSTICTQLVYHRNSDDDLSSPLLEKESSPSGEDPFFFGVLRRATRLGSSFRPRLCRGVDVVDATRIKTKLHLRSKSKHDDGANLDVKSPKTPSSFVDPEPSAPVKEFKSLSEYFESQERLTPRSICKQIISEEPLLVNVEEVMSQQLVCIAPEVAIGAREFDPVESVPEDPEVSEVHEFFEALEAPEVPEAAEVQEVREAPEEIAGDLPARPQSRPFGNEALDASYRKTMEVLAKLPTRGACRIHTLPPQNGVQGAQKVGRSESKGNKQEVKGDSRSNRWIAPSRSTLKEQDSAIPHDSCSIHAAETVPAKPRSKGSVKKSSTVGFDASTVSCRAKAVVKAGEERPPMKAARSGSRECSINGKEQGNVVAEAPKAESFTFDSRVLHSGNKQSAKMAAQQVTKVDTVSSGPLKTTPLPGATGWPFEQPARPRDFKGREDRPLIPGLTSMDWEKSFQEAVIHSEPPADLVLHECSQCGRTFKLESLQKHMRGCKPKSSASLPRRVSV